DYKQAITRDPDNTSYLVERGRIHRDGGNENAAIADFRQARDKGCDRVELFLDLGRSLRLKALYAESNRDDTDSAQKRMYLEAIQTLEKAAQAKKTDWSLWAEAADVCLELHDGRLVASDVKTQQACLSQARGGYERALNLVQNAPNLGDDERRAIVRRLYR